MYLLAEQTFEAGSEKHAAILANLAEQHLKDLADPDYGFEAYVSGWNFTSMEPEPAYARLVEITDMVPTVDSPHFTVARNSETTLTVSACCAYWRKANHVHNWFVSEVMDGVDDCSTSRLINGEELADLVDRCKQVLDTPVLAASLLPTVSGFFFGSVDYDEWYLADTKHTIDRLNQVFETYPKPLRLRYRASW